MKLLLLSFVFFVSFELNIVEKTSDSIVFEKENIDDVSWYLDTGIGGTTHTVCCCAGGIQYACDLPFFSITCTPGGPWDCLKEYGEPGPTSHFCEACCPSGNTCA